MAQSHLEVFQSEYHMLKFFGQYLPKLDVDASTRLAPFLYSYDKELVLARNLYEFLIQVEEMTALGINTYASQTADVDFTKLGTDPIEVLEAEARAHIIDWAGDNGNNYEIVVLASRQWFSALIAHPQVTGAYSQYPSTQEMLRRRLGGNANNRIFEHKNILFIEDISGNIEAGDAYIFPRGIDRMFEIYYAPSDTLADANQTAQELYVFFKESQYLREAKIESETSFLSVNNRPELVVKSTGKFQ